MIVQRDPFDPSPSYPKRFHIAVVQYQTQEIDIGNSCLDCDGAYVSLQI